MAQSPPVAPVRTVKETHFGIATEDPYRYMEDFKSAEVQAWVKGQAEFADKRLKSLPGRAALLKRIEELDADRPFRLFGFEMTTSGGLYFFKQATGENVAKVVRLKGEEHELLIDPETFPKTNPNDHFTISFFRVSPDERRMLYGFASAGSEQTTLKVFDLETKKDLPEAIDRLEAEYAHPDWDLTGRGFYYSRRRKLAANAPATEGYKYTQAFYHLLGAEIDNDRMVFAWTAPGSPIMGEMDFPAVIVPAGSSWAIGQIKHGDETDLSLYAAPISAVGAWTKVCDRKDQVKSFAVHGDDIYLLTAKDAPRFKVIKLSLFAPSFLEAKVVLPAGERVLNSLDVAQDALYVGMLSGTRGMIARVPFTPGKPPQAIAVASEQPSSHVAAAHPLRTGFLMESRSWTRKPSLYEYAPEKDVLYVPTTPLNTAGDFDFPENLTATEVMVPSHDGVNVPLSILHRADIKLDGTNPTLLSGYGAYGATMSMRYDPVELAWIERGGVLAFAHVRGGGAFGKEWHHAGRKTTKPNTWKDFIACAEYLVKMKYTSPGNLAGKGGSAGGILIGRAITERPDLFAAAQISVGCTDMLRFESTMNGPPNVPEFGTITKEDEFRGLLAMSTLHHIKDGVKYPAVLLTHGINDPRVEPWESAKATARFQAATGSGRPVLFRVDYHSGHGIGSTKKQRREELADVWSFLLWQFGDAEFQPIEKK